MFSFPFTIILVDRNIFKFIDAQYPINFPPNKTIFCDISNDGRNKIEIKIIPVKKKIENNKFLNMNTKV